MHGTRAKRGVSAAVNKSWNHYEPGPRLRLLGCWALRYVGSFAMHRNIYYANMRQHMRAFYGHCVPAHAHAHAKRECIRALVSRNRKSINVYIFTFAYLCGAA